MEPKVIRDIRDLRKSQSDLSTDISNTHLTSKYYRPTATISDSSDITSTVNFLPTTWSSSGSNKYVNGDYIIESNVGSNGTSVTLPKAFDEDEDTYYNSANTEMMEVTITLPRSIKVNKVKYQVGFNSTYIESIEILGSKDKTSWSSLYKDSTKGSTELVERTLTNKGEYKYYRIKVGSSNPMYLSLYEFQFSDYTISTANNNFSLEGIPNPLSKDQRILILTPIFDVTGITSNTFNGVTIDTLLKSNKYYELVYNGTIYLAREVI